ncbi:MAG TPA: outer membrane protein assembly factor BamA [Elusimicrobiales bacterium]|nr:outer membrane protein assembly factor BamA [Elusimicrobiales bacterium]
MPTLASLLLTVLLAPGLAGAQAQTAAADVSVATAAAPEPASQPTAPDVAASTAVAQAAETAPAVEQPREAEGNGPWKICAIEVKGLFHVKERVIKKQVKAKKGEPYQQNFVSEDIQAIIGLGGFENASVSLFKMTAVQAKEFDDDTDCHTIIYTLREKPLVKEILVKGNDKFSRGKITGAMDLKKKDPFDKAKLIGDMDRIAAKYLEKGYTAAKADFQVTELPDEHLVSITVTVREGKQARVKDVQFLGATAFKPGKLLGQTKNKPGKIFDGEKFARSVDALNEFYKNRGYPDFQVEESSAAFSEDKSQVFITYKVNEGSKGKFGRTYITGNTVFSTEELLKTIDYKPGKIYNEDKFRFSLSNIQNKYAEKGYLKMVIDPKKTLNAETGQLDMQLDIVENSVVYIDHIDISGNKDTKTFVFRREVVVHEGDIFNSARIRKSQERIMNLGFIDDVQMDISPTAEPDKVDVVFDVAEGRPGMFTMGAAVSSLEGLYGMLSVQHLNFLHRAHKLSLSWNFGTRIMDYSVSWTNPWFMDHPTSFGVDLFNTRRLRPYSSTYSAYRERRVGGRVRVGPRFEEDKYQLNTAYTYQDVTIDDVDNSYTNIIQAGTSVTSSIYAEFAVDTRDNIWDPTRGWRNSISYEFAGGPLQGTLDYYKFGLTSSYNQKLFEIEDYPFVWAFSNRFGLVDTYGKTAEVPIFERYFIGGQDTVRGYDYTGQIGPNNGGNCYYVFNTEFRFPLAREKRRTIVQGAFFLDVGGAWSTMRDMSWRVGTGQTDLKAGTGFGIRFTTPAFPIRLDWGYGFNHKAGESPSQFYFTIGNMF